MNDDWLALTVRPPWSWAIAHGPKDVENRTGGASRWRRAQGRKLMIHAGSGWSVWGQGSPLVTGAWWGLGPCSTRLGSQCTPEPFYLAKPDRVAGMLVHPSIAHPDPRFRIHHAAVVATCRVVDVHDAEPGCCTSPWAEWHYTDAAGVRHTDVVHLVLAERIALPHDGVGWRQGRLGLWQPPAELVEDVEDEMPATATRGAA